MHITILELLEELQSFINVPVDLLAKAEVSLINSKNNKEFDKLKELWVNGNFDNDPEVLLQRLSELL